MKRKSISYCAIRDFAISAMANSTKLRIRERTIRAESLDQNNARDSERVVRIFLEVDVGPVSSSSTTQNDSHCESFFYLYRLIRCERDECGYSWNQNFTVRSFGPAMAKSTKLLQFYFTQNFLSL